MWSQGRSCVLKMLSIAAWRLGSPVMAVTPSFFKPLMQWVCTKSSNWCFGLKLLVDWFARKIWIPRIGISFQIIMINDMYRVAIPKNVFLFLHPVLFPKVPFLVAYLYNQIDGSMIRWDVRAVIDTLGFRDAVISYQPGRNMSTNSLDEAFTMCCVFRWCSYLPLRYRKLINTAESISRIQGAIIQILAHHVIFTYYRKCR